MSTIDERIGAAMGAVYVVVLLGAGSLLADGGEPAQNGRELVRHIADDAGHPARLAIAYAVEVGALLAFVVFAAYLGGVLRRAGGAAVWLSAALVGGAVASVTIKLGSAVPGIAAMRQADDGTLQPDVALLVRDMSDAAFFVSFFPLVLVAAAFAAVVLRSDVAPRWLGWLAAATAVALLLDAVRAVGSDTSFGPSFLLFLLWALLTSGSLVRRPPTSERLTAPGTLAIGAEVSPG